MRASASEQKQAGERWQFKHRVLLKWYERWLLGVPRHLFNSEAEGVGMEFCHATIAELMKLRRIDTPILLQEFEGYVLDFIKLLMGLSPRQVK